MPASPCGVRRAYRPVVVREEADAPADRFGLSQQVVAGDGGGARGGSQDRRQAAQRGRLPGPVRAEEPIDLPGGTRQGRRPTRRRSRPPSGSSKVFVRLRTSIMRGDEGRSTAEAATGRRFRPGATGRLRPDGGPAQPPALPLWRKARATPEEGGGNDRAEHPKLYWCPALCCRYEVGSAGSSIGKTSCQQEGAAHPPRSRLAPHSAGYAHPSDGRERYRPEQSGLQKWGVFL